MSLALAPVILTLGAGPSGFSKQLSGRRPKLPRQPWQTRAVARARSVILALGAGPSGFPKQFSGRRPKLLRQPPSRSLPSFWRWRLARRASRNKFPSDAKRGDLGRRQPWQIRAVARARSVISALGAGPSGFSKQLSGRRPKLPRQPWQTRAVALFWRWGLARRASRNNFPGDGQSFCDSLPRSLPSFWRWGLARRPSRNKFPSDAKRGDLGRRQPWQTRAVARARSVISALGAGPSGFRKQSSGRSFRDSHGKPAPSLAHAPLFWRWGLARRASRNKFPSDAKRGDLGGRRGICGPKPMSQHGRPRFSRARARPVAAMAVLSTRSGQMARSLASGCGWPISYCPV